MHRFASSSLLLLALVLPACATTRATRPGEAKQAVRTAAPRIDLGYTDRRYFALKHLGAVPAGTQSEKTGILGAPGGWISGRVCGVDVVYDVRHHRRELWLNGHLQPDPLNTTAAMPAHVFVRDRATQGASRREIFGVLGPGADLRARAPGLDFWMNPERLEGRVGRRRYQLRAEEDRYVGTVQFYTRGPAIPFVIYGRSALWTMPAADQAAILPLMLSCANTAVRGGRPILSVNFDTLAAGEEEHD